MEADDAPDEEGRLGPALARDCRLGGRVMMEPSPARRVRFLVSSTPNPGPPASSSRLAWRRRCRPGGSAGSGTETTGSSQHLLSKSGRRKCTEHRSQVYPSRADSWLRAWRRRCSARVKVLPQVGQWQTCDFMRDHCMPANRGAVTSGGNYACFIQPGWPAEAGVISWGNIRE